MRKIILLEFITLDGIIQAPGGPKEDISGDFKFGGWTAHYFDDFSEKIMAEQMKQPFSLLLGIKTFEIFASYWPTHSDGWPGINEATKFVASKTLSKPGWQNTEFLKGDTIAEIKKPKNKKGQIYMFTEVVILYKLC